MQKTSFWRCQAACVACVAEMNAGNSSKTFRLMRNLESIGHWGLCFTVFWEKADDTESSTAANYDGGGKR